jgi:hypothetical protein
VRLRALLPPAAFVLLSFHLEALAMERVHGALGVDFNMKDGRVGSIDFERRSHWRPGPR